MARDKLVHDPEIDLFVIEEARRQRKKRKQPGRSVADLRRKFNARMGLPERLWATRVEGMGDPKALGLAPAADFKAIIPKKLETPVVGFDLNKLSKEDRIELMRLMKKQRQPRDSTPAP
jgi:hypothetical protein